MACGSEIERKYLVAEVPGDLEAHPAETIEQGYIAVDGSVEVRLRRRDATLLLTVKSGSGRVRVEEELEIDARRFDSLWPLSQGARVSKTRHRLPGPDGLTIELDVYTGELAGLVVAEVEFESPAASDRFQAPPWFGPEVTDDRRYANRALAVDGIPAPAAPAVAAAPVSPA
jgi:CYTH domain-containing protein